jgi:hypothetical protein
LRINDKKKKIRYDNMKMLIIIEMVYFSWYTPDGKDDSYGNQNSNITKGCEKLYNR